jgi:hypothetical protein
VGGNAVRLWLHVDGSVNPTWSEPNATSPGVATGMDPAALADLKWMLAECHKNNISVLLSLWSHDVLAVRK